MHLSPKTLSLPAAKTCGSSGPESNGHQVANFAPPQPSSIVDLGIERDVLEDLTLKLACTVPRFTTEWAAKRLCLPFGIVAELLEKLRADRFLNVLGQAGPLTYHFAAADGGRKRAIRLSEICGYVGPAPVSLEAYTSLLEQQLDKSVQPSLERIQGALGELVLQPEAVQVASLSILARRSLFLYGPPGNGKTTLAHLLRNALVGDLWIPHCIAVDHEIIRVYDSECHEPAPSSDSATAGGPYDQRWVRIRPPFIIVGGELTIEALDLIYTPSLGYYQAPLHMKANGGIFLLDDFGCQRATPQQLLNRWIHPLERQVDFLTLRSGQQIKVPFRQMLAVATNLDPEEVMTPAFLRRMGYRVYLDDPTPAQYAEIFRRYAATCGVAVTDGVIDMLLGRHSDENRPLRSCEPRDLIERSRDLCQSKGQPLELNNDVLETTWRGYFGNR